MILKIISWPFIESYAECMRCYYYGKGFFTDENNRNIWGVLEALPLVTIIIGIITTIFAYIKFIVSGGYLESIKLIKENGIFFPDKSVLVQGTVHFLFNKYLLITIAGILVIEAITAVAMMCCVEERKSVKISALVLLFFGTVLPALLFGSALYVWYYIKEFTLPEFVGAIFVGVIAACLIGTLILITKNPYSSMMVGRSLGSAVIYFVVLPLLLFAAENVLGIVGVIVGTIIAVVMIMFIGGAALSGSASESGGSASSGGGSSKYSVKERTKMKDRAEFLKKEATEYRDIAAKIDAGKGEKYEYAGVTAKGNRSAAADMEREIANIEKELNK